LIAGDGSQFCRWQAARNLFRQHCRKRWMERKWVIYKSCHCIQRDV
jgi:hypothetical protein